MFSVGSVSYDVDSLNVPYVLVECGLCTYVTPAQPSEPAAMALLATHSLLAHPDPLQAPGLP